MKLNGKEYYKLSELPEFLKISERTIRRLIKADKFPKGKQLTSHTTLWSDEELSEWLDER